METRTDSGAGTTVNAERILLELDQLPALPDAVRPLIESPARWGDAALLRSIRDQHAGGSQGRGLSDPVGDAPLLVCQCLMNHFEGIGPVQGHARLEFWRHSLTVGHTASLLAERVSSDITPQAAFLLGLFHDLGKAALFTAFPKSYARVEGTSSGRASCDIERNVFGIDHSIAGRHLAGRWGLADEFAESMWLHHSPFDAIPSSISRRGHVQMVALSNMIAHEFGLDQCGHREEFTSSRAAAQALGISADVFDHVTGQVADRLNASMAGLAEFVHESTHADVSRLRATAQALSISNASLIEQEKRLRHVARLGGIINAFNQRITPATTTADLCGIAAGTVGAFFRGAGVVLVFERPSLQALNVGLSAGGREEFELIEAPSEFSDWSRDFDLADSGVVVRRTPGAFAPLIQRYRGWLPEFETSLFVIRDERGPVGSALISVDPHYLTEISPQFAQLHALSSAIARALALVKIHEQALSLSDELATANQRIGQARTELVRQEAGQSMASTAAGIAHELNNPLAVISGRAQILLQQAADPQVRDALELIVRQAATASEIAAELSELAREPAMRPQRVDLSSMLKSLRSELISRGLLTDQQFKISLPSHSPIVHFDPDLLRQIFRELFSNALEATEPSIRLLSIKVAFNLAEEHIAVHVSDNGRGMKPEILDRVFDPFFSHQPAGRKRGLGLARVSRWLSAGRGKIRIRSSPQQGTQVELLLPTRA